MRAPALALPSFTPTVTPASVSILSSTPIHVQVQLKMDLNVLLNPREVLPDSDDVAGLPLGLEQQSNKDNRNGQHAISDAER